MQESLSDLVDHLPTSGAAERDDALGRLANALSAVDATQAGLLALGCGGIVEYGGDPLIAIDAMLAHLSFVMGEAARYRDAYRAEQNRPANRRDFSSTTKPPRSAVRMHGTRWSSSGAAITMLARSPGGRRRARNRNDLHELVDALVADDDHAVYLSEILDVLDDEDVFVLHPAEKLGYRVRIDGIADNFQLHTLLAAALIGDPFDGWISSRPVPPRVAAAARDKPAREGLLAESRFDLFQWTGLQGGRHAAARDRRQRPLALARRSSRRYCTVRRNARHSVGVAGVCSNLECGGAVFDAMPGELTVLTVLFPLK